VQNYQQDAHMIVSCALKIQDQTCYHNFYEALADTIRFTEEVLAFKTWEMAIVMKYVNRDVAIVLQEQFEETLHVI
jgi:hypothetical protein